VAIAGRAFWFYLGKLAWPHPLIFIYPRWTIDSSRVLAFAPFAAAAVVLFALWLGRNGWSGRARPFFFAMAYFAVSLFPVLGFFSIYFFRYSFVADHFQYLAAIGPLALAGAGIAALGDFIGRKNQVVLHGACGVLLLALGILSFEQSGIYRDIETLWRATLRSNPGCWLAFNNLGDALMQSGRPADAEASYQKALALHPDYADAHNNLGNILRQQGRLDEAIAHYEKALAIQPAFADALNDLGTAFLQQGRVDEAAVEFEKAAAINPGAPEIHYNLGNVLLRQRRPAEAAAEYQKALKLKPDYAAGRNNLATALLQQGRVDEAVDQFREAIRNDPAYAKARINLAAVLRRTGHATEAASQYEQALKIDSSNAEAQSGLAWILAAAPDPSLRNGARAVALAENANQSTGGGHPEVLRTLAAAYAEAGRFPEAVDAMARALQTPQVRQNQTLAMALREELQLYQSGAAFRDPRMAAAPANQPGG
jgi:tetratricopeptide (TPR) repeat protein